MAEELKTNNKFKIMAYKMKGSPMARNFGIGSRVKTDNYKKNKETKPGANLLKIVPNKKAFDKLSDIDKKGFTEAGIKAGLPTIESPVKHDWQEDVKQADGTTKKWPVKHKHKARPKAIKKPTTKTKVKAKKYKFPPIGTEVVI